MQKRYAERKRVLCPLESLTQGPEPFLPQARCTKLPDLSCTGRECSGCVLESLSTGPAHDLIKRVTHHILMHYHSLFLLASSSMLTGWP